MFCLSCGKELKEGTIFCTGCGRKVEESDAEANESEDVQNIPPQTANQQSVNQQDWNYQSMNNQYDTNQQYSGQQYNSQQYNSQQYNSQQNNKQIYGMNNIDRQQGQPYGYPYSNQGYRQPVNNYGISPHKIYKRSVLPYKIVSAVLNLISVAGVSLIALLAVAFEEEEFSYYFKSDWVEGFQTYGFIAFLITLVLFIFVILGFAGPAKAGVGMNLITSIACTILAIWGVVLNGVLLSKINDYIREIGFVYNDDVKPILCMTIAIGVVVLFLQIISFSFSCIGLTKREN